MIKGLNKKFVNDILTLHKLAIFSIWEKAGRDYSKKEIKDYINFILGNGKIFGYFEANKLIECAGIEINKKNKYIGRATLILVNPKFQGRGIGKKLMKYIEGYAKGKVIVLKLDVLIKNEKAIRFYEKNDYKKLSYTMVKKL